MARRKAAMLLAPASPADTSVVVPWKGMSSSAGMPMADPYGKTWACRSIRPGVTSLPEASSTFSPLSAGMSAATASTTPKRMPISRLPLRFWLGSSTSPPLITRSNLSLGPMAAKRRAAARGKGNDGGGVRKELAARGREHGISSQISFLLVAEAAPATGQGQGNAPVTEVPQARWPVGPRAARGSGRMVGGEGIEPPTSSV